VTGVLGLDQPAAFFLLPVPLVVRWLAPPYREARPALRAPFFDELAGASGTTPAEGAVVQERTRAQVLVGVVVWCLLVTALARPVWIEPPIERQETGRDLLLAVDLSGSMATRDFTAPGGTQTSRLDAVKAVIDDFLLNRQGDRVGLIVFGSAAHAQVPFTPDLRAARALLAETRVAMAGPQTAVGDAIGLGIKLFEKSDPGERVMILLTDGNDTASRVTPKKAAELAAREDVTIYPIGVGDPTAAGEDPLDVATLNEIAAATGGEAFLAENRTELERVYATLDQLEPSEFEVKSWRPRRPLFVWPLGFAVALMLWTQLVRLGRSARAAKEQHA